MNSVNFSVVIPTYNGERYLAGLLDGLKEQVGTENISWEIVIVDNNSSDNTPAIVKEYRRNWPKPFPLLYSFEIKQGAAFARHRGVKEAKGEFIGFIDDDAIPEPDWVAKAYAFGKNHPEAGAWGSCVEPKFEVEPPSGFAEIAILFALDASKKYRKYEVREKVLPSSCGLVVRKKAWVDNVPVDQVFKGCGDDRIYFAEDIEAGIYIQRAGWEIWHNPEMRLRHFISKFRLEKKYLMNMCRGNGLARYLIRKIRTKPWQRPFFYPLALISDFYKYLSYVVKKRKVSKDNIGVECLREYLLNTLISPFYFWKEGIKKIKINNPGKLAAFLITGRLLKLWRRSSFKYLRTGSIKPPYFISLKGRQTTVLGEDEIAHQATYEDIVVNDVYGIMKFRNASSVSVVADVGANIGIFSKACSLLYPAADIYAYEPNPAAYKWLKSNAEGTNIKTFLCAVSNRSGMARLSNYKDCSEMAMVGDSGDIEVKYVASKEIAGGRTIDILKLDCEGAEFDILADRDLLKRTRFLTIEYHCVLNSGIDSMANAIRESGYDVIRMKKNVLKDKRFPGGTFYIWAKKHLG